MRNVLKRIRNLEAKSYDSSGFVPHSPHWLNYWRDIMSRSFGPAGEPNLPCVPIDAFREIVRLPGSTTRPRK